MSTKDLLKVPVEECVEQKGAHLIELGLRGEKGSLVVEVFIDNEIGVTSDVCSEVSRSVNETIEKSGLVKGAYRLEVSSPGIDRPLVHPWQFKKHLQRPVEVLVRGSDAPASKIGLLVSCEDDAIAVREKKGQPEVRIPLHDVIEIRVKAPW
jgi:ribosome maturation factor RimP